MAKSAKKKTEEPADKKAAANTKTTVRTGATGQAWERGESMPCAKDESVRLVEEYVYTKK